MIKHQGGCHCGAIRFSTEYDPMLVMQCNCISCRKISGSMTVSACFAEDEIEMTGKCKEYTYSGGSGMPFHRGFCENCGQYVYGKPTAFEGFIVMTLGSFDDPNQFEPKMEIHTINKLKWLKDDGCVKDSFEEGATVERMEAMMENLEQRG